MWKGPRSRQKRWYDFLEDENKVKRDLRRLIHSVQHIPSTRSRLDANSLWDLVGELESFNPPGLAEPMQLIHKTEKKCFSKNYLNLRLYPSKDTSKSSHFNKHNTNLENKDVKDEDNDSLSSTKFKKSKKKTFQQSKSEGISSKTYDKTKIVQIEKKDVKDKKLITKYCPSTTTVPENVLGKKSKNRNQKKNGDSCTKKNTTNNEQDCNSLNKEKSHLSSKNNKRSSNQMRIDNFCKKDLKTCNLIEYQVLDKIQECKSPARKQYLSCHNKMQHNKVLQSLVNNRASLTDEQSSVVKKLTNYWNKMLNNELDDEEIDFDSSVVSCCSAKSYDQLTPCFGKRVDGNGLENHNITAKNRNRSESSINVRRLNHLNNFPMSEECFNDIYNQSYQYISEASTNAKLINDNSDVKNVFTENNVLSENFIDLMHSLAEKDREDNCYGFENKSSIEISKVTKKMSNFQAMFDTSAENIIKVMNKLITTLELFPKISIMSEEINLPQSVKTVLCLMVATESTVKENLVLETNEQVIPKLLQAEEETRMFGVELLDHSESISPIIIIPMAPTSDSIILPKPQNSECKQLERALVKYNGETLDGPTAENTLVGPVITMEKVKNALKFLNLCQESLCKTFLFGQIISEDNEFKREDEQFFAHTFTFVYEREINIDEVNSEEYIEKENTWFKEEIAAVQCVIASMNVVIRGSVESLFIIFWNYVECYWPDSIERYIYMMYQSLVSILIWYVIIKEVFIK